MHKEDGQMRLTATFRLMQSEQQMIVETIHRPVKMMNAPYLDSVEPRRYQPLRINITLDVQHMFYNRKSKMVGKQESDRTEQG